MGLDMYLVGKKFLTHERREKEDGFRLEEKRLELGYWRKHPDLHGFIVNEFAGGRDECQDIELDKEALEKILSAVRANTLPHTEGFFFGESTDEKNEKSIPVLQSAIIWLETPEKGVWKSVIYRASW